MKQGPEANIAFNLLNTRPTYELGIVSMGKCNMLEIQSSSTGELVHLLIAFFELSTQVVFLYSMQVICNIYTICGMEI